MVLEAAGLYLGSWPCWEVTCGPALVVSGWKRCPVRLAKHRGCSPVSRPRNSSFSDPEWQDVLDPHHVSDELYWLKTREASVPQDVCELKEGGATFMTDRISSKYLTTGLELYVNMWLKELWYYLYIWDYDYKIIWLIVRYTFFPIYFYWLEANYFIIL